MARRLINLVNVADVRMVKSGCSLGFMGETLLILLAGSKLSREKLERDEAVEFEVLGFVHHTHSAFTEFLQYSIM
jgi:hypothetical protein